MKNIVSILSLLLVVALLPFDSIAEPASNDSAVRVGWIGGMTGPTAKWGTHNAAMLAVEEVNASGGINGRPLELVYEDAQCNGAKAVSAFRKLTGADGLRFIVGGHCSPESLAFADLAERKKVVSIAAITSSPKLTEKGDYIYRVTPISTRLADLLVPYARKQRDLKKVAVIYELTDYAQPVAEHFSHLFKSDGGQVVSEQSFLPGETDFKTILLKASRSSADGIYLGVQAPDTALLLMRQIGELNLNLSIFGNEQFAGAYLSASDDDRKHLEGVILAEPACDLSKPETKRFAEKYKSRYGVRDLPFGCYTGESYDAVLIMAQALRECGEDVECVKKYLNSIRNHHGASGAISFDANGDVEKQYVIKAIRKHGIIVLDSAT